MFVAGSGGVRWGAHRERSDRSAGPCRGVPPPATCAEGALKSVGKFLTAPKSLTGSFCAIQTGDGHQRTHSQRM